MVRRHALRNDQWLRIESLLPGREGTVGVTAKDNRLFVEAVLYRYRAGIPWRDLPERFGDFRVVHTRFSRWVFDLFAGVQIRRRRGGGSDQRLTIFLRHGTEIRPSSQPVSARQTRRIGILHFVVSDAKVCPSGRMCKKKRRASCGAALEQ